jgi:aspartate aminotransferase
MQMATGWAFANAVLQHSLARLEKLSVDVKGLQRRRDRLLDGLARAGYEARPPEGTFYVLVRSPWADDAAFVQLLAEHDIFCLPGSMMDLPGYFRLSLTATDAMVERALPGFRAALAEATGSRADGQVAERPVGGKGGRAPRPGRR